jgi:hypothetical protein
VVAATPERRSEARDPFAGRSHPCGGSGAGWFRLPSGSARLVSRTQRGAETARDGIHGSVAFAPRRRRPIWSYANAGWCSRSFTASADAFSLS